MLMLRINHRKEAERRLEALSAERERRERLRRLNVDIAASKDTSEDEADRK
jgi:hypothetical protein